MKKSVAVPVLLSLLLLAAQVLTAQTRPRRVGQPAGTQTTNTQPAPSPSTSSRPPVLGGNTNAGARPTASSPAPGNEPEDVGEGDVVRVNTTLVTLPVSVMDRNGRYIPDLRKEDFRIYEDGVEQQVAYFASVEKPFTVALVIDTSGSTRFKLEDIQDAAISFVNQLRADDRVLVVSFDDRVRVLAEATNDRSTLRNAIRQTRTGDGTRLYDAVDFVINQRLDHVSGRKAVVLFTDGVDTTSKDATYQSNMRDAEELDALIYPVQYDTYDDLQGPSGPVYSPFPPILGRLPIRLPGIGGVIIGGGRGGGGNNGGGAGASRVEYARADAYLHDLAAKTGARLYRADDGRNLDQAFALVAEELRRQYSIGYYPKTAGQAGQRKQVKVHVNRPDLAVRARDSYIVGSSTVGTTTAQDNQKQAPVLRKNRFAAPRENNNLHVPVTR